MFVGSLKIAAELVALIETGQWPRSASDVMLQNTHPLVQPQVVRAFAPDESTLVLYAPPFHTLQRELDERRFSAEQLAAHEIEPDMTVVIADFGLGSDTVVALDFRADVAAPTVIRLQWRFPAEPNRWLKVAHSFPDFWAILHAPDI